LSNALDSVDSVDAVDAETDRDSLPGEECGFLGEERESAGRAVFVVDEVVGRGFACPGVNANENSPVGAAFLALGPAPARTSCSLRTPPRPLDTLRVTLDCGCGPAPFSLTPTPARRAPPALPCCCCAGGGAALERGFIRDTREGEDGAVVVAFFVVAGVVAVVIVDVVVAVVGGGGGGNIAPVERAGRGRRLDWLIVRARWRTVELS
jgi:hypothetical protein